MAKKRLKVVFRLFFLFSTHLDNFRHIFTLICENIGRKWNEHAKWNSCSIRLLSLHLDSIFYAFFFISEFAFDTYSFVCTLHCKDSARVASAFHSIPKSASVYIKMCESTWNWFTWSNQLRLLRHHFSFASLANRPIRLGPIWSQFRRLIIT